MPLRLTPLADSRFDEWLAATRNRLIRLGQDSGMRPGEDAVQHADAFLAELLPAGLATASARILTIDDGGTEIGVLWLGLGHTRLFVVNLSFSVEPTDAQLQDLFDQVRDIARAENAAALTVSLFWQDAAGWGFVAGHGFEPSSIQMVLDPLPDRHDPSPLTLEPMSEERFARFIAASEADFAQELAASGRMSLEDATTESRRLVAKELPDGLATADQLLYVALVDGAEVGILWIAIRRRGGRDHAFILNVEVDAAHHRKGYGRAIMHAAEEAMRKLEVSSIGLHVFGANHGAVALYEQLGYRRLEELLVLPL
ncbi:GCN5-related N-acetyltransferase [Microbacterium esteraromaticum]|uniref:GCN5-related N-acetyltransferase n=1 Tax=Microbacterium esteraromaticum TaxID=57043 RepID=A0A1R4JW33_9MICO|nr:GNAT family N-acetyltransferase [Microbacterium esteraromaticum]SJN36310.1 GCN5-related N-acetyltransferase [Microbacterium esteraromaticum]